MRCRRSAADDCTAGRPLRRDPPRVSLARPAALQHRRAMLRPLGEANARCGRGALRARGRQRRRNSPTPICSSRRTASPMRCGATAWQRGDRVAIVMPQRFETAVANMAVYQLGAVAMPLSMLFGPDALQYRLHDSQARVRDRRRERDRQPAGRARRLPAAADGDRGGRRARAGRSRLVGGAARRKLELRCGADARRRCGGADLHQRHHRPAQGRADPASRADRQPERLRVQPELVPSSPLPSGKGERGRGA